MTHLGNSFPGNETTGVAMPEDVLSTARVIAQSLIGRMCMTMDHSFGLQSEQEQSGLKTSMSQLAQHDVAPSIARAILAERERCAVVVERGLGRTNTSIAKAIRQGGAA